jgi:hypothetical protein
MAAGWRGAPQHPFNTQRIFSSCGVITVITGSSIVEYLRIGSPDMLSTACRTLIHILNLSLLVMLTACSSLPQHDPLRTSLAGIEPLPGEGLEARFAVKLRVQNPNDHPIDFNGVTLELQVNKQPMLSGVSAQSGQVPRYGETLVTVPVSLSAYAALQQAWAVAGYQHGQGLPYELRGKLANGLFGTWHFNDRGTINWP